MNNLLDYDRDALAALLKDLKEPAFRASQLFQWLWQKGARDLDHMTNLSKALRAKLAEACVIDWPTVAAEHVSSDGTVKLLLKMADGALIETVLIPEKDHVTQCLSTQVGCALECTFCATGTMGLVRNLTHGEICGQILAGRDYLTRACAADGLERNLRNLVFMGMGEPLMNFANLAASLRTITDDLGLGFGSRRVTVSTSGVPGKIIQLGELGLANLAVSLHAPTQDLRAKIMPKAAAMHPLPALMDELNRYPLKPRERITFEYILLAGVNDAPQHARELVRLLSHTKCKVNLIAANCGPDSIYQSPTREAIEAFEKVLWDKGVNVVLRKSKGQDIEAACGQLVVKKTQDADTLPS